MTTDYAGECRVTLAYAPNCDVPLDVVYDRDRPGERCPPAWFAHTAIRVRYLGGEFVSALGVGTHFVDQALPWQRELGHVGGRLPQPRQSRLGVVSHAELAGSSR